MHLRNSLFLVISLVVILFAQTYYASPPLPSNACNIYPVKRIPFVQSVYDICGICGGDNSSCNATGFCLNNTMSINLFSPNDTSYNISSITFRLTMDTPWFIVSCTAYNTYGYNATVTQLTQNDTYLSTHDLVYNASMELMYPNGTLFVECYVNSMFWEVPDISIISVEFYQGTTLSSAPVLNIPQPTRTDKGPTKMFAGLTTQPDAVLVSTMVYSCTPENTTTTTDNSTTSSTTGHDTFSADSSVGAFGWAMISLAIVVIVSSIAFIGVLAAQPTDLPSSYQIQRQNMRRKKKLVTK